MGIERFLKVIDNMSEWSGRIASYAVLYIMLTLAYEVVARYVFNAPTIWVYEINEYVFCLYVAFSGAFVMLHDSHTNVDILYQKFSPKLKLLINIFAGLCFYSVIGVLLWKSAFMAWESWEFREESFSLLASPIYPAKMVVPIGTVLFLLQGTAKFIRDVTKLITGNVPANS